MDPLAARVAARFLAALSSEDKKAIERLNSLKGTGTGGESILVPFGGPHVESDLHGTAKKEGWNTSLKTMSLSEMTPTQEFVLRSKMEGIIKGHPKGPALVARSGGKNLILDGHHRLTADYLRGQRNVRVEFTDLDALTGSKPPV
jgi:hypothetical protein